MFGMQVPAFMLKQFYQAGSLKSVGNALEFALINPLMPATIVEILEVSVSGIRHDLGDIAFAQRGVQRAALSVAPDAPVAFRKGETVTVTVEGVRLTPGTHPILVKVKTDEFGPITVEVEDHLVGQ